jgi:hypothetical protein
MESTSRLAMPLLAPGQAQKELVHNEALLLLDFAVAAAVEEPPRMAPPESPSVGQCYIVAADATGPWAGWNHAIAGYTSGGWRFIDPTHGLSVHVKSSGSTAVFTQNGWTIGSLVANRLVVSGNQVVGERSAAIADPSGGSVSDAEARTAIVAILSALRQHGLIST